MISVTIWNEFRHEQQNDDVKAIYPKGIHKQLASFLPTDQFTIKTATLDEEEHGLTEEVLANTDVLLWWWHIAHEEVSDDIVDRVHTRILEGMGFIPLHSAHFSKIFKKLMGTTCNLKWCEDRLGCKIWNVNPGHPIVEGIGDYIELEEEKMYGEHFDRKSGYYFPWFSMYSRIISIGAPPVDNIR